MAEKRMFNRKLISSDAFLDLPLTAQGLFFHLCMRADDDGFVDSPNKIMREVKATKKDFNVLKDKRYILVFDSGIVLIKHWFIHNTITKDRYTPTLYVEERSKVMLKCGKSYPECKKNDNKSYTECIQVGYELEHRLDKNRLEKDRKEQSDSNLPDFNAEKAWDDTFSLYPKKTAPMVAKQEWFRKMRDVLPENYKPVALLIANATKLYLADYKEKNADDESMRFIPKYGDWLNTECDYWIQEYEKRKEVEKCSKLKEE